VFSLATFSFLGLKDMFCLSEVIWGTVPTDRRAACYCSQNAQGVNPPKTEAENLEASFA
jgi:hypothetical protein